MSVISEKLKDTITQPTHSHAEVKQSHEFKILGEASAAYYFKLQKVSALQLNQTEQAMLFQWYKEAAKEKKNYQAQYNLGLMLIEGMCVEKDLKAGMEYLIRAAEGGIIQAQFDLAVRYDSGEGLVRNQMETSKWLRIAAENGHALAQLNLGIWLDGGKIVPKQEQESLVWYRKAAVQGLAEAQYRLAASLFMGNKENEAEAMLWFQKAANQGNINAQLELMIAVKVKHFAQIIIELKPRWSTLQSNCEIGYLRAKEAELKIKRLKLELIEHYRLAEQIILKIGEESTPGGNPWQYNADLLKIKQGLEAINSQLAIEEKNQKELQRIKAEEDKKMQSLQNQMLNASYHIGLIYIEVKNEIMRLPNPKRDALSRCTRMIKLEKDVFFVFEELSKMEHTLSPLSQYYLGWMIANGLGTEKNHIKALEWYQKAADQGVSEARSEILLLKAQITPQDNPKDLTWLRKSKTATQGIPESQNTLQLTSSKTNGIVKNEYDEKQEKEGFPPLIISRTKPKKKEG